MNQFIRVLFVLIGAGCLAGMVFVGLEASVAEGEGLWWVVLGLFLAALACFKYSVFEGKSSQSKKHIEKN